jgi:hypothetical protein
MTDGDFDYLKTDGQRFHRVGGDRGQMSRSYVFRCRFCVAKFTAEWMDGKMTSSAAQKFARKNGWSLTKDGWLCKRCEERTR